MPQAATVLQAQRETGGIAQLANGRRVQRVNEGIANAHERTKRTLGQGLSRMGLALRSSKSFR